MGCRIIVGHQESRDGVEAAVLYCSTTGVCFGPVMESEEDAQAFIEYLPEDPRSYSQGDLMAKYSEFLRQKQDDAEFVAELNNRKMSTWTRQEENRYNQITGQ